MSKQQDFSSLFIVGPTASGKTAFVDCLMPYVPIEVINIDIAQCYSHLAIGTAKPHVASLTYTAHLFDLVDEPIDINAARYRILVTEKIAEIRERGNVPVIVGGSHFYVRSLFFPPNHLPHVAVMHQQEVNNFVAAIDDQELWSRLNAIDPVRAQELHANDSYRLRRALTIWYATGKLPSSMRPQYDPICKAKVVAIMPERHALLKTIERRAISMIEHGWIQEAERLIDTPWETFVVRKGFIGYEEIFTWIREGKQEKQKDDLIETIVCHTAQYAKRQVVFLKKLLAELSMHQDSVHISVYTSFQSACEQAAFVAPEQ